VETCFKSATRSWQWSLAIDVYNLSKVDSTIEGVIGPLLYGFNIIGVRGRPLVTLAVETRDEAEAAHKAMLEIVATAKLIKPHAI
jgi:hypothetical protein